MTALLTWLTVATIELIDDYVTEFAAGRRRQEWRREYQEHLASTRRQNAA